MMRELECYSDGDLQEMARFYAIGNSPAAQPILTEITREVERRAANHASGNDSKRRMIEVVWMNY